MPSTIIIPQSRPPVPHSGSAVNSPSATTKPFITVHVGRGVILAQMMKSWVTQSKASTDTAESTSRASVSSDTDTDADGSKVSIHEVHWFSNSLSRERFSSTQPTAHSENSECSEHSEHSEHLAQSEHNSIGDSDRNESSASGSPSISNNALVASIRNALRGRKILTERVPARQFGNAQASGTPASGNGSRQKNALTREDSQVFHCFRFPEQSRNEQEANEFSQYSLEADAISNIYSAKEASRQTEHSLSKSSRYDVSAIALPNVEQAALATILDDSMDAQEQSDNDFSFSEPSQRYFAYNHNNNFSLHRQPDSFRINVDNPAATPTNAREEEGKWPEDHEYSQHEVDGNGTPLNASPRAPTFHASMMAGQTDLINSAKAARLAVLPEKKPGKQRTAVLSSTAQGRHVYPPTGLPASVKMKHCGQVLTPAQQTKLAKALIKTGIRFLADAEKHFYLGSSTFGAQRDVSAANVKKHMEIAKKLGDENPLHSQFESFAAQFGVVDFHDEFDGISNRGMPAENPGRFTSYLYSSVDKSASKTVASGTHSEFGSEESDAMHKAHAMRRCVLRLKQDLQSALKNGEFKLECGGGDGEVQAVYFDVLKGGHGNNASYQIPVSLKRPKGFDFDVTDLKDLRGEPVRARAINIKPAPLAGEPGIPVNIDHTDKVMLEHAAKWAPRIYAFHKQLIEGKPSLVVRANTNEGRKELKKHYDTFYKMMTEMGFTVNRDFDYSTPKTWKEKIKHACGSLAKRVSDVLQIDDPYYRAEEKLDAMARGLRDVYAPLQKILVFSEEKGLALKNSKSSQEARQPKRPYQASWVVARRPREARGLVRNAENGKWNYRLANVEANAEYISPALHLGVKFTRKYHLD